MVLILADDLGVEGLNCYGGTSYRTPRLDRLAAEGLRFTQAYAQPLCTNSRVQLMTGYYNNRNWLYFGCLDPRAKTIGHWMKDAGYHTAIAGKWQLTSYDPPDYPGSELRRGKGMKAENAGFDEYSLWHTGHTEDKGPRYADPVIYENGKFRKDTQGKYGEDVWVEFIKDFMHRHKDSERPFFVYYPMTLPHWPFVPTPNSEDWGIQEKMHPPLGTTGGDTKYFPDMVAYMDEVVGRVVDAVDDMGLKENTLIIYYADNGTDRRVVSYTSFGAIAGGKGSTTDAGTHVPLIVRWPGTIKPGLNEDLDRLHRFFADDFGSRGPIDSPRPPASTAGVSIRNCSANRAGRGSGLSVISILAPVGTRTNSPVNAMLATNGSNSTKTADCSMFPLI